jgi:hypothetical protein
VGALTWRDPDGAHHTLVVTFTVLVGTEDDEWYPAELCVDDIPWVLDTYLSQERLSCCSMQGGYFMELDGASLVDGSAVDEFRMTMTWFPALANLCRDSRREQVWAWEESGMTLTRDGTWLDLEDKCLPRMRVPFVAFTEEALREAQHFAEFVRRLGAEVARRRSTASEPALDEVVAHLPTDLDQQLTALRSALARVG